MASNPLEPPGASALRCRTRGRLRPTLPVVLCTGFSEKISADRARALGIDRFVMKPVVGAELVQVIRAALDRVSC